MSNISCRLFFFISCFRWDKLLESQALALPLRLSLALLTLMLPAGINAAYAVEAAKTGFSFQIANESPGDAGDMAKSQLSATASAAQPIAEMISPLVQFEDYEAYREASYDGSLWDAASGTELNGGQAYMTRYGVFGRIYLGLDESQNADGDTVSLVFRSTGQDAIVFSTDIIWDGGGECWHFTLDEQSYCEPISSFSKHLLPGGPGAWTFDFKVNGSVVYSEDFVVVPPAFSIVGPSTFTGEVGSLVPSPLVVQLLDFPGGPPAANFEIAFRLSLFGTDGYLLSNSQDFSTGGTKTLTVKSDEDGLAKAYARLGYPGTARVNTINAVMGSSDPEYFYLTALGTDIENIDEEENLGEIETPSRRDPCVTVGNPINVITGNKFHKETDIAGTSPVPLAFVRYYNSKELGATVLGPNWRHSYDRSITFAKEGKGKSAVQIAKLKRPDGKAITFVDEGLGWSTDPDNRYRLEKKGGSWLLHTPDDSVETYNGKGVLVAISDARGNSQTLSYKKKQLVSVNSDSNERLEFSYDAGGLLVAIDYVAASQDPVTGASRTWTYGYDSGQLTSVTQPDGRLRHYHYEESAFPHALTGITDERGIRYATWEYDSRGNATASYHGYSVDRVEVDYNINGERVVTDSRGNTTTYNAVAQLGKGKITGTTGPTCDTGGNAVAAYEYDPATNNVLSRTLDGVTTLWGDYDARGNAGLQVEAAVTGVERRTGYAYDSRFQSKITRIAEESVYPGESKVTTQEYDDFGNLLSRTQTGYTPAGTPVSRTTRFEYNGPYRQLSAIDGPRTDVADITNFEYYPDDPDLYQHQGMLLRVTHAEGIVLRDNLRYNAFRQLIAEDRPNGLHLSYEWEPGTDRLAAVTETAGGTSRTTRWTYLASGEVETLTPPDGNTLTFAYDEARRLERITDSDGNYIAYTLDDEGNVTEESTHADTGALRRSLSRSFDVYNRLDVISQANEAVDHDFAPDGTLRKDVNGNGVETRYDYDALKRLTTTVMDASGSDPGTANTEIRYGYNPQDGLTAVTAPNQAETHQQYDDLGNRVSLTSPDTGTASHQYDNAGNRTRTTDAKGQVFSYTYDALNRLLDVDVPGTDHDLSYGYDHCPHGEGRLCTLTRGGNTTHYAYNGFGQLTSIQQQVTSHATSVTATLGITYDSAGRLKTLNYPGNLSVTYSYDGLGNVSQVSLNRNGQGTTVLSDMRYEPFGPWQGFSRGNGLNASFVYDQAYRLTAINDPVYDADIHYDANGNITHQARTTGTLDTGYDALDKLISASDPGGTSGYQYDRNGNRTRLMENLAAITYGYQPQSNRLSSIEGQPVTLDANGNTTHLRDMALTYSPDNRLLSVTHQGATTHYGYNASGERVIKISADNHKTVYNYGPQGQLLAELDGSGQVEKAYIHANSQPIAVVDYSTAANGELYYIHNDHLGTPQALTDETGQVIWKASYRPFGLATVDEDPDQDGVNIEFNLRFPGQYFDEETGLHYNYFRDYDPSIGRYVQSDPIGLGGGLNTFGYVAGNPLSYYDEYGLIQNVRQPRNVRNARNIRRQEQLRRQQQSTRDRINNILREAERTRQTLDQTLGDLSSQLDNLDQQLHPQFPTVCVEWDCPWDDRNRNYCIVDSGGPSLEPPRNPLEGCRCVRRAIDPSGF